MSPVVARRRRQAGAIARARVNGGSALVSCADACWVGFGMDSGAVRAKLASPAHRPNGHGYGKLFGAYKPGAGYGHDLWARDGSMTLRFWPTFGASSAALLPDLAPGGDPGITLKTARLAPAWRSARSGRNPRAEGSEPN